MPFLHSWLIQALVISLLDYCSSVVSGRSASVICPLEHNRKHCLLPDLYSICRHFHMLCLRGRNKTQDSFSGLQCCSLLLPVSCDSLKVAFQCENDLPKTINHQLTGKRSGLSFQSILLKITATIVLISAEAAHVVVFVSWYPTKRTVRHSELNWESWISFELRMKNYILYNSYNMQNFSLNLEKYN